MGLPKGRTNNENGRPKGKPNLSTNELRERVTQFIENNWETISDDFEKLEPKERLDFLEKMLRHTLPRPLPILESLSDEDLNRIIEQLKNGEL